MITKHIQPALDRAVGVDERVQELFKPLAGSALMRVLDRLSKFGDQPEVRLLAGGLVATGIFAPSARLVRAGARMLIAHEAATSVKNLLKTQIDRTRPRSATSREDKKPRKGKHRAKEQTSFPSGHSAGAIAAARAFSREFPEYGAAAMGAAGLIAATQVVRCAHYPTDVAAGAAIGLAVEAVTNVAWNAASMDDRGNE
jgi:membrane-associated phospholipid phosphatase